MSIDIIVEVENGIFDEKHVWVFLDEEVDWTNKGCGFIYRNFNGAFKTKKDALKNAYGKMFFLGGDWKLEANEENYVSYTRGNGRVCITKYNLEGPSIFDMNH